MSESVRGVFLDNSVCILALLSFFRVVVMLYGVQQSGHGSEGVRCTKRFPNYLLTCCGISS